MKKNKLKETFTEYAERFKRDFCHDIINCEYWRDEYLKPYGYVWVRWHDGWKEKEIIKDLKEYITHRERDSSDGIFFVKLKEDKIRILCRSKENLELWQKILFLRLSPTSRIFVTEAGNLSFDLDLTDIEKRILNENTSPIRL